MSVKNIIDAVLTEHIGDTLTLELAAKLSAQLVESVLMSREGAGLPEKPGDSTNRKFEGTNLRTEESKKGKKVIMADDNPPKDPEPEPEPDLSKLAKELEPPKPRAKAIVSAPFEGYDPSRDPEDQPDTMPFTIRRGKKG